MSNIKTKKVKISKKKQLLELVAFMAKNLEIAKGLCKSVEAKEKIKELTDLLNSNGPPTRSAEGWLKVWSDLKYKTKKKIILKSAQASGNSDDIGKQVTLTPIEEAIEKLLTFNLMINSPYKPLVEKEKTPELDVFVGEASDNPYEDIFKTKIKLEDDKSTNINQKFNVIEEYLKKIHNEIREINKLKRKKFEYQKLQDIEKMRLRREKIILKKELLKIKKLKILK